MLYRLTSKGNRKTNEDSFDTIEKDNIKGYFVADGCGGHASGNVASKLAVEYISERLEKVDCDISEGIISEILWDCNKSILDKQHEYGSMRTTIVGLVCKGTYTYAFNIGDSRLYQIRGEKVIFQTEDHAIPFVLYKAGIISEEEINTHEDRNKLLQALGVKEDLKYKIYKLDPHKGDLFLLASDGFWEHIYKQDFEGCTPDNAANWLTHMKKRIIEKNDPEQDNYTAILVGDINE